MSKIPDHLKSKYNKDDKFAWVDSQWEKFMTEQKELKAKILELTMENSELKDRLKELGDDSDTEERSDEWRIEQFNRNRAMEDQVSTIEEMEESVKELFSEPEYIYERNPDTGQMYRREVGKHPSERVEIDTDGNPIPVQLELFDAKRGW